MAGSGAPGRFTRDSTPQWHDCRRMGCQALLRPCHPSHPLPPPPLPTAGKYALPWDMTTPGHRQFNPLFVLQRSATFLREATQTLRRRWGGPALISARSCAPRAALVLQTFRLPL